MTNSNIENPDSVQVPAADTPAPDSPVVASSDRRFAEILIDLVGLWSSSFVFGLVLGFAVVALFGQPGLNVVLAIPHLVLGIIFGLMYYIIFEGIWARTPGKWICGTRVVDLNGAKPKFGAILFQTAIRHIPFEAFSFLGDRTGWHDRWSHTRVVIMRKPRTRPTTSLDC